MHGQQTIKKETNKLITFDKNRAILRV